MQDYNPGHATSIGIAPDITLADSATLYEDPPWTHREPSLSEHEIEHFKRYGFVIKRGLIDDRAALRQALDHAWDQVPRGIISRDNPETWLNKPHEKWTAQDAEKVGLLARGNWKIRSRGEAGFGTDPILVRRVAGNPRLIRVVEQFLGGPMMRPRRVRGIYFILPKPPGTSAGYGVHADYSAAHLSAMVLIDSVPPRTGGFTVWPGSHLRLHEHWDTVHGGNISDDRREGFRLARDEILRDTTPMELTGEPGDVVFWHSRILHSAGINHSAEWDSPRVRAIVPVDFQIDGRNYYDDVQYGPGPNVQYWVDTRNFRNDETATADNVWDDWGI